MPQSIPAILAVAASAAGTGLSIAANNATQKRANSDINNELSEQRALQARATPIVEKNIQASSAPKAQQQISTQAANDLSAIQKAQSAPLSTAAPSVPTSTVTNARTQASNAQQNQAAAQLAGYGGWQNQTSIGDQQVGNQLSLIGSQSANAAGGLPLQLAAAGNGSAPWQAAGSILNSLGGVGLTASQLPNYRFGSPITNPYALGVPFGAAANMANYGGNTNPNLGPTSPTYGGD